MARELKSLLGWVGYVLLACGVVVTVVTVRLLLIGHHHFQEARHLKEAGQRDRAIASLERRGRMAAA